MSEMDGRREAFENKYAHDEALKFKVEARGSKIIGEWAAEELGITDVSTIEAYAKSVVVANLEKVGFEDVKEKIRNDFAEKNIEFNEAIFDKKLAESMAEAKLQIMQETE